MSVIWQSSIYGELHGMGLDLSENGLNGLAETRTDEGD